MPEPKYNGVKIRVLHNGGRHTATYIIHQPDPYYSPMEALQMILPSISMLHNIVMITFSQAYK